MNDEVGGRRLEHLILVLGMHRSGTSALTGALQKLGASLGAPMIEPAEDNPKGFFEHAWAVETTETLLAALGSCWDDPGPMPEPAAVDAQTRRYAYDQVKRLVSPAGGWVGPLGAIKDPRLCRQLAFWKPALTDCIPRVSALLAIRNPADVIASLMRRDNIRADHAGLIWLRHYLDAERETREFPRGIVLYEELLNNWRHELGQAGESLGITGWSGPSDEATKAVDGFLDSSLRNHNNTDLIDSLREPVKGWIEACSIRRGADREQFFSALASVGREVDQWDKSARILWPLIQDRDGWRKESEKAWAGIRWHQNDRQAKDRAIEEKDRAIEELNQRIQRQANEHRQELDKVARAHREEIDGITSSRSWRVTRPLRGVMGGLRRIRARVRAPRS